MSTKKIPKSVQDVINQIDCNFIKYNIESLGYLCHKKTYKNKKGKFIGFFDKHVINTCRKCQERIPPYEDD